LKVIQEQRPVVVNPIQDTVSHKEPLLAFHSVSSNEGDESNVHLGSIPLRIEAQLGGRIKLPDPTTGGGPPTTELNELTFYRRNLFKVSGRVCLPREGAETLLQQGIVRLVAKLDAIESIEGETVKLIRIPIKNDAPGEDSAVKGEPVQPVLLDHQAVDVSGQATLDMCWDRLQFRRATTKTRGSVAQRYQLRITIIAITNDQSEKVLARVASEFIVVRGRSPKNYPDQAKGQYFSVKTTKIGLSPPTRRESIPKTASSQFEESVIEPRAISTAIDRAPDTQFSSRMPTGENPFKGSNQQKTNTAGTLEITDLDLYSDGSEGSSSTEMPTGNLGLHSFMAPDVDGAGTSLGPKLTSAQNWLELRKAEQPPGGLLLPSLRRQMSKTTDQESAPTNAGEEEPDSYEYIPLSINDWSAPVDPVYVSVAKYCPLFLMKIARANEPISQRPHGVHHKAVKDQYGRSAAKKRYFIDVK
jgi:hypothetical protein